MKRHLLLHHSEKSSTYSSSPLEIKFVNNGSQNLDLPSRFNFCTDSTLLFNKELSL